MKIGAWVYANKKNFISLLYNNKLCCKNSKTGWEYLSTEIKQNSNINLVFECSEKNTRRVVEARINTGKVIPLVVYDSLESDGHAEIGPIAITNLGEVYDTKKN